MSTTPSSPPAGRTVEHTDDRIVIRIPLHLKRRGGRKEIHAAGDEPSAQPAAPPQEPLVKALARAHVWQRLLEDGSGRQVKDIAEQAKVHRSYVTRTLQLTCLAPDIVEAVLRGEEPSGLSFVKLVKNPPLLWSEQRERFGFPAA